MAKEVKKSLPIFISVAILLIVAYAFRLIALNVSDVFVKTILTILRSVIHITLVSLWCSSVYYRVVNKQVRNLLLVVGALMLFWILSKTIKIEFFPNVTDVAIRYMWYGYYIPMILIPLIGIFITMYIGKPYNYKKPSWTYLFYIPALILLVGIFTNDLHNWAFTFPNGIENFNDDYSYGVLFWITATWFCGLGILFVVLLIRKSKLPGSKKMQKVPLYIICVAIVFWILYATEVIDADLTIIDCLIIIALLESAMQTGLIPINTNYHEIFESTTIPVAIIDNGYVTKYCSGGATSFSKEDMLLTATGAVSMGNKILSSSPIRGGRVVWQDDVEELNQQRLELDEIHESLAEEGTLIQAENEIKEKQAQADEKSLLYDKVAREVSTQLTKVLGLISIAENEKATKKNLAQIAIIGTYIKRRGNLILLNNENELVSSSELASAFRESSDNLKLLGISSAFDVIVDGEIPLCDALKAYDLYEEIIEALLEDLSAVFVRLKVLHGGVKLTLELGAKTQISMDRLGFIAVSDEVNVELDDEDIFVTLTLGGGVKC
ncbi:MAG: hypothetical protein IKA77_06695 [Clostridia bacterium]|nr:hypothetical protein [Clostridia bacterium]